MPEAWAPPGRVPLGRPPLLEGLQSGEVEKTEEWIHQKAVPSPQTDQDICLKGEEWCFATPHTRRSGAPGPKRKKGRSVRSRKKGKKPGQTPVPQGEAPPPPVTRLQYPAPLPAIQQESSWGSRKMYDWLVDPGEDEKGLPEGD
ncbi:UNVERIFIED_CONTAM: hypothetical protein FKN15_064385 [Acipenser sinensis]